MRISNEKVVSVLASESLDRAALTMNLENGKQLLATMERKDKDENGRADKCPCACHRADPDNEGFLGWRIFRKRQWILYWGPDLLLWFYD